MLMTALTEMVTSSRGRNKFYGSGVLVTRYCRLRGSVWQLQSEKKKHKRKIELDMEDQIQCMCIFPSERNANCLPTSVVLQIEMDFLTITFQLSAPPQVGHIETIPPPDSRLCLSVNVAMSQVSTTLDCAIIIHLR